jgi:4'-phosphopantetheinyl transferase
MITIYYTSFEQPLPQNTFSAYLNSFPEKIRDNISAFKRWQDAHASLFGKLLLKKGLGDLGIDRSLSQLKYTRYGRPYFENLLDFNISHSGTHIVCAFCGTGKIGIDLEEVKPIEIDIYKDIFHDEEWTRIATSQDKCQTFLYYWTAKESIVKAEGGGLNIPLKKIHVKEGTATLEQHVWYFTQVSLFENYILQVASDKMINNIRLQKLDFYI